MVRQGQSKAGRATSRVTSPARSRHSGTKVPTVAEGSQSLILVGVQDGHHGAPLATNVARNSAAIPSRSTISRAPSARPGSLLVARPGRLLRLWSAARSPRCVVAKRGCPWHHAGAAAPGSPGSCRCARSGRAGSDDRNRLVSCVHRGRRQAVAGLAPALPRPEPSRPGGQRVGQGFVATGTRHLREKPLRMPITVRPLTPSSAAPSLPPCSSAARRSAAPPRR